MDIFLIVLTILLSLIVLAVNALNTFEKTSDLTKIADELLAMKSGIESFCIGRTPVEGGYLYRNARITLEGEIEVFQGRFPIDFYGKYIFRTDYGVIEDLDNGFRITGAEIDFSCPAGYTGPTCTFIPICDNEKGKLKPVTYTQFNELALFLNSSEVSSAVSDYGTPREKIHPRLRVKCLDNKEFELQSCPTNMLLNRDTLECEIYDICQDSMNGRKHNFQVTDRILANNEYYICRDNVSKLTICNFGTVFSSKVKGCIQQSACFEKKDITLQTDKMKLDNKSYIQCSNDVGIIINCPLGVVESGGRHLCKGQLCMPKSYFHEDKYLKYQVSQTVCEGDKATFIQCTTNKVERKFKYKWVNEVEFTLSNWPDSVMEGNNCVSPKNNIIYNTVSQLQLTDAMSGEHPFDFTKNNFKGEFVCDPARFKYRWAYDEGKVIGEPQPTTMQLINTASPCQNEILPPDHVTLFPFTKHPNDAYICITQNTCLETYEKVYLWPCYNAVSKEYFSTTCSFTSNSLVIKTVRSSDDKMVPVNGFQLPSTYDQTSTKVALLLQGYENHVVNHKKQYYFIASGKPDYVLMKNPQLVEEKIIPVVNSINPLEQTGFFTLAWHTRKTTTSPLDGLQMSPTQITYKRVEIDVGFIVMWIEKKDENRCILHFGEKVISVEFNPHDNNPLKFE